MTIAEQLEARGFEKGQAETTKEIAQKLLQMEGVSIEYVACVTSLSIKDLESLIDAKNY